MKLNYRPWSDAGCVAGREVVKKMPVNFGTPALLGSFLLLIGILLCIGAVVNESTTGRIFLAVLSAVVGLMGAFLITATYVEKEFDLIEGTLVLSRKIKNYGRIDSWKDRLSEK